VTESTDTERTGEGAYGEPTSPDPNQAKNEPIGTSPETSPQGGESARASTGDGAEQMQRSAAPPADGGVPTPGDSQGVAVPSVQSAAGTSEQSHAAEGVKTTSLAPPGKPDGEVDTRS
jgi:hypothetical protein